MDEGERTNEAIMKLVERVEQKVDKKKELINYLDFVGTIGVAVAAVTVLRAPEIFQGFLTPPAQEVIIREAK